MMKNIIGMKVILFLGRKVWHGGYKFPTQTAGLEHNVPKTSNLLIEV